MAKPASAGSIAGRGPDGVYARSVSPEVFRLSHTMARVVVAPG
jgi:hypothetical protein